MIAVLGTAERHDMELTIVLLTLWLVFLVADLYAYAKAKYPERKTSWVYRLPGGGFAALRKYGRDGA